MPIGLTFDLQTDPADERQAEFDPPATIAALTGALESLGHHVTPLGAAQEIFRAPERLRGIELVFNIAEGRDGRCREAWVPTLLDLHGVPYVGSDPLALTIGLDKAVCKQLAWAAGIPTPRWMALEHPAALPAEIPLAFPVIVKPRWEGSGRGIDAGAVVRDHRALAARAQRLFARCPGPILIEELIDGGELTVCVIGNDPPVAHPAIQRPLDPATGLSCHVVTPAPHPVSCPLTLDDALDAEARRIALAMFATLGCRDMARVDLRVDAAGRPFFLEINPLPSFDPAGSFSLLAEYLGRTYAEVVGEILHAALVRCRLTPALAAR